MSKAPWKFTKTEVRRAVATVEAATGKKVVRVRFHPDGGFEVIVAGEGNVTTNQPPNPWDEVYEQTPQAS
jgi:hypothetical protein